MGFLPIIVAILGFLLLWGIVNFYSIRQRKSEVEAAESLLFSAAASRNQQLKNMADLEQADTNQEQLFQFISRQLDEHRQGQIPVAEKLLAEKKVSELILDIPPDESNAEYQQRYRQLQEANKAYQRAASLYRLRSNEYNELITKNPSKMLARMSGYKPTPQS